MENSFSVITINLNNLSGLKKTVASIQKYRPFIKQYIVDGGSKDGSAEWIEKNSDLFANYLIEPDEGVYDAMNKGLKLATTGYACMLNSGDTLLENIDEHSLQHNLSIIPNNADVLLFPWYDKSGVLNQPGSPSQLELGEFPFCHQAMLISTKYLYSSAYKIFGDHDLLARIYSDRSVEGFFVLNIPLVQYEGGGLSEKVSWQKRHEKILSLYNNFGLFAVVKFLVFFIRRKLF